MLEMLYSQVCGRPFSLAVVPLELHWRMSQLGSGPYQGWTLETHRIRGDHGFHG